MSVRALIAARQEARSVLGRLRTDPMSEVRIVASDVTLTVPAADLEMSAQHARRLAEKARAREIQTLELERAATFRSEVLSSPAAAFAYWAMNHPNVLDGHSHQNVLAMIDAACVLERQENPWQQVAKILVDFVTNLDVADRRLLLKYLARTLDQFGDSREAAKLDMLAAEHCGLPPLGPASEEP
jgi:hypothetical protein